MNKTFFIETWGCQRMRAVGEENEAVILSREDGEGSPATQLETLRSAQGDDNAMNKTFFIETRGCQRMRVVGEENETVILSREDGEGSQITQLEILRSAQDDAKAMNKTFFIETRGCQRMRAVWRRKRNRHPEPRRRRRISNYGSVN